MWEIRDVYTALGSENAKKENACETGVDRTIAPVWILNKYVVRIGFI